MTRIGTLIVLAASILAFTVAAPGFSGDLSPNNTSEQFREKYGPRSEGHAIQSMGEFSVTLRQTESSPDGTLSIEVRSTRKEDGEVRTLCFSDRIKFVSEALPLAGNRIVICGEKPRGGNSLFIVSLESMALVGRTDAFDYTISPNGQFVAFWSWHPEIVPPEDRESVLLFHEFRHPDGSDSRQGDLLPKPIQLYPDVDSHGGNSPFALSPFLWSPAGDRLFFVAFDPGLGREEIICIDLTEGVESAILRRKEIDPLMLVNPAGMSEETRRRFEDKGWVVVERLEWKHEDSIVLKFPPTAFYRESEVVFDVSVWMAEE